MDFGIPLATGQSVLMIHYGARGTETKEILDHADKFRSYVGSTGAVRIVAISELGISCTFCSCHLPVSWYYNFGLSGNFFGSIRVIARLLRSTRFWNCLTMLFWTLYCLLLPNT